MTRKRFRTIQSTNIGSSSSQPPTSRIASSSHQATLPIDAVSQTAPSTPIEISSKLPTVPSPSSEQPTVPSPSNDDETHEDARVRKAHGATRMAEVWNLEEGEVIPTQFNDMGQPVGVEGGVFGQFTVSLPVSDLLSPKGPMGDVVKRRFFKDLGEKWRNHKCALKERHFDEARTSQEDRSQRGKQSRPLQTSLHTGGSRSFARHAYEMVNRDAQNVAHPEQVPSIPRSAHASINDLGATLDASAGAGDDSARAAKD
ncbi:hypothetical protein CJ030_MR7G014279 [Morella rubra]|uniref:Uncharacterized protein n=1 Tax=Morella rubra TaxID=262757 RepID=A0A6A1V0C4_9ROSI|nr:hypothetical protein CJ030_MR7G014279 [Morella rubra]